MSDKSFVLGVDLDGVVADFYMDIRPIVAEWLGEDENALAKEVTFGMKEWGIQNWGIQNEEYQDLHRFAVSRDFFRNVRPIDGAPPTLRRLSKQFDVRIRIITHRLYLKYIHQVTVQQTTVQQTIEWLEKHGVPYWDLCFMNEKDMVGASVYIEDGPENIKALQSRGKDVIIYNNSTNMNICGDRAYSWADVESLVTNKVPQQLEKEEGRKGSKRSGIRRLIAKVRKRFSVDETTPLAVRPY